MQRISHSSKVIERLESLIAPERKSRPVQVRRRVVRWGLESIHVRVLAVVLVFAVILSLAYFVSGKARGAEPISTVSQPEVPEPAAVMVFIHVAGDVRSPGVYTLPIGSRVIDAINAAGGVTEDASTDTLNLARIIEDGEQVLVGAAIQSTSGLLNLNTASVADLDRLPGIGPVIASRIVEWRNLHGRFRSVDQLKEVQGVGAATFASLKTLIVVQ